MGTFYFMQGCFPYMRANGGKIVNVGSAAGTEGMARWGAYSVTKEAIRAITRVDAKEWGKYNINVNAICPASVTPAIESWMKTAPTLSRPHWRTCLWAAMATPRMISRRWFLPWLVPISSTSLARP